jgi:hypothetical protein
MNKITGMLKKKGPSTSTEILNVLLKNGQLTEDAGRKRIQRSIGKNDVCRLESINFKNNTKFLYLSDDFDTKRYWDKLVDSLRKDRNLYYYIIQVICLNGGIVSEADLRVYSASPDRLKGRLPFEMIRYNLLKSKILHIIDVGNDQYEINKHIMNKLSYNRCTTKLLLKEIIIKLLANWFVINGLSYKKSIRMSIDSNDCFFHYYWHLYGKSFILDSFSLSKDVFIVVDILQNDKPIAIDQISYYIKKVEATRSQSKKANFLPILISEYFHKDTLLELRKKKIMATTIKNLLGEEVAKIIKELQTQLINITKSITEDPKKIFEIIKSLRRTVGITDNLKGKLFEFLIATTVYYENGNHFEIGKLITDPKTFQKAEIDILTYDHSRSIEIYECKSYFRNNITETDIKDWFLKINRITSWIKSQEIHKNREIKFYYYTLSDYDKKSKEILDSYSKYQIEYLNKIDIEGKIKRLKEKDLITTYNDFFK